VHGDDQVGRAVGAGFDGCGYLGEHVRGAINRGFDRRWRGGGNIRARGRHVNQSGVPQPGPERVGECVAEHRSGAGRGRTG